MINKMGKFSFFRILQKQKSDPILADCQPRGWRSNRGSLTHLLTFPLKVHTHDGKAWKAGSDQTGRSQSHAGPCRGSLLPTTHGCLRGPLVSSGRPVVLPAPHARLLLLLLLLRWRHMRLLGCLLPMRPSHPGLIPRRGRIALTAGGLPDGVGLLRRGPLLMTWTIPSGGIPAPGPRGS